LTGRKTATVSAENRFSLKSGVVGNHRSKTVELLGFHLTYNTPPYIRRHLAPLKGIISTSRATVLLKHVAVNLVIAG
jgi:hypothetical protein